MEVIVCLENLVQNVGRLLCGAKETNSYAQNVDILCTYHRTRVKEGKVQSVQPVEDLRGLMEDATHVVLMTRGLSESTRRVRQYGKRRTMFPSLVDTSLSASSALPCIPHSYLPPFFVISET